MDVWRESGTEVIARLRANSGTPLSASSAVEVETISQAVADNVTPLNAKRRNRDRRL